MPLTGQAACLPFLVLAGLAAQGACLQVNSAETQDANHVGNGGSRGSMLVALNGHPGGLDLLLEQGKRVLNQHGQLMLTSHEDAELPMVGGEGQVKIHAIKPNSFCSAPAVGNHEQNCESAEADNKFLGAAFMANQTRHGFKWLLLGADDTSFFLEQVEEALEEFSPKDPHYFGIRIGGEPADETRPKGYESALENCPRLGPTNAIRFWSVNTKKDITAVEKDCDPKPFRDDSWFSWAKGGEGIILSAGLLNRISTEDWQQCVDRIVTFGGDVRIALCLALLGYPVEKLNEGATGKLSAHKLALTKSDDMAKKRLIKINKLKNDDLFNQSKKHTGNAESVSQSCSSWQPKGMSCEAELPEHRLVRKWIPQVQDSIVMEFGARFGTTSCEIAKMQSNSGNLVVVEPDVNVWEDLEANLKKHSCNARMLRGVVSSEMDLEMAFSGRYTHASVSGFRFDMVEAALGKKVNTLLIDCKGCAKDLMDQLDGPIKKKQIKLILIEADMPKGSPDCGDHCMDYKEFYKFLKTNGFTEVDKINDCDRRRTGEEKGHECNHLVEHKAFRLRPHYIQNSRAVIHKLRTDIFDFARTNHSAGAAKSVSEGCETWRGRGLNCKTEIPEHSLIQKWVSSQAMVMEVGARFGTLSCEIAKKQNNSGNLIVVEPDLHTWKDLKKNLETHECNAHVIKGGISNKADFRLSREHGGNLVPGFKLEEVESAVHKKPDTFIIDCEECMQVLTEQLSPKILKGQVKMILIGVGKKKREEHEKFFSFLAESGFEKIEEISDCYPAAKGCDEPINHYVFRQKEM